MQLNTSPSRVEMFYQSSGCALGQLNTVKAERKKKIFFEGKRYLTDFLLAIAQTNFESWGKLYTLTNLSVLEL